MKDRIYICLVRFSALALALSAWLSPPVGLLPLENRAPAAFSLADPDAFFFDRLPFRHELLLLCRNTELALGKNEYAGAFRGKNGYLFSNEQTDAQTLRRNLDALADFASRCDAPVYTALVPSKTDALLSSLPRFYDAGRTLLWDTAETTENYIDLLPLLRGRGGEGKAIYYRGDHHLTSLGAYYVYRALAAPLGFEAAGASDFSVSVVCGGFSGSDARKLLTVTDESIALFRYAGDSRFTVRTDGKVRSGLYNFDALGTTDPYGIFPGYGAGLCEISSDAETARPRLLLLCDSYGCALAPLLARHFDLTLLDLRYAQASAALTNGKGYAAVLCFYGMDTLAAHEILYKLNV